MNSELAQIWSLALSEIEKDISKPSFETWLKTTRPVSINNDTIIIEVPNVFTKDWLESRYKDLIIKVLRQITSSNYDVNFVTSPFVDLEESAGQEQTFSPPSSSTLAAERRAPASSLFNPNPRYTFETFVVGDCNRLAHAAALAVAEAPSRAYNPLFIYGGVGLGKTHLLHAIGQHIIKKHNLERIFYFSSEKFTNEFINAIRDNKTVEFRNKYRNVDVLLIDDIQFLAGKEQTQEEFFHTFNALHENNRQIVISSDRPPKEIPTLEDRLRSRFEWGLITDIQPPDLETRIAILKKIVETKEIHIPDEILQYIATKIDNNIRELEGALIRILAYASLSKVSITMQLAEEALKNIISVRKRNISVQEVIRTTAQHFNVTPEEIIAKKRTQHIALVRQAAMYLCRELTDLSLPRIGEEFGGRDHTTVLHACKKIEKDIQIDKDFKNKLEMIKQELLHN